MEELKITTGVGDRFELRLDPIQHPTAYQRRKDYFRNKLDFSEEETERILAMEKIPMEIFYDNDGNIFALESELLMDTRVFNPYSKKEIPNDNIEIAEESVSQQLDNITCVLSNVNDELNEIFAEGTLSNEGDEVLEQAIILLEDCLTEIHKFTNPDDQKRLFEEDFDEED